MKQTAVRSPYKVLKEITRHQWLMFLVGFLAWVWDAFDFFTVTMTVTELSEAFQVSTSDITWVSNMCAQD
jgi:SHS family lactate transporter-like MFS transporter